MKREMVSVADQGRPHSTAGLEPRRKLQSARGDERGDPGPDRAQDPTQTSGLHKAVAARNRFRQRRLGRSQRLLF